MARKKQHKVGQRFKMHGLTYEVRESSSCAGCACMIGEENHCTDSEDHRFEPCYAEGRYDDKDVIFIHVG